MSSLLFEDSEYYAGPDLTDDMIVDAESRLGYKLPRSYVDLLRVRNGGKPKTRCYRTPFATSWAPNHIQIDGIRGLGGDWGVDTDGPLSSEAMIEEWGYPRIGIVICDMPSGGHDAVMLDYSRHGAEPAVSYVDEDRVPRPIAESFSEFIDNLLDCRDIR